ncbi:hypothetical protein GPICK_10375 [Geobacter pickeringii]|uniref:Uncharacterized protein n=1 Tax=Geobacter pickeringii TaxID=345632 RepID=A0A0B5BAV2_9BACT|nr:hypothetical protein GPICK_10375 [Geobacter pickeringii]
MVCLGIGPMGSQIGGNGVNLAIQLFTGPAKLLPDIRQFSSDLAYLFTDAGNLGAEFLLPIRQDVGNEIEMLDLGFERLPGIPDLLPKRLMSFENKIELPPDIFKNYLKMILFHLFLPAHRL